jgi:hypothetical protein
VIGQAFLDATAQAVDEFVPLGTAMRVEGKPVGEPAPVLLGAACGRTPAEVAPELVGDLEDHEPVRPCREPALAPELIEFSGDREQRVGRGLMCQIVELRTRDLHCERPPAQLAPRHPEQQLVKLAHRVVPSWP